jgi:hypothetical protein
MKKVVCTLLMVVMLMSAFCAYASTDAIFEAFTTEVLSANSNIKMSLKLNRPFELLDNSDYYTEIKPSDMVNSFANMEYDANMAYSMSEDKKIIKLGMDMQLDLPLEVGENFKADIWAKVGMWMDMDLTDTENPVYKLIFKIPFSDKYYVMDFGLNAGEEDFALMFEQLNNILNSSVMDVYSKKCYESIKNNFTLKSLGANRYELSADDKAFKAVLKDILDMSVEMLGNTEEKEEFAKMTEEAFKQLENITILGERGMKTEFTLSGTHIIQGKTEMHICLNIYDIMSQFGEDIEGMVRESSYMDFDIIYDVTMTDINKPVTVEFPVLTEDNSVNMYEPYEYEEDYYEDYISPYSYAYDDAAPVIIDGELYVPIRSFMNSIEIEDDKIGYADGAVTIDATDKGILEFNTLQLNVGSCDIYHNGQKQTMTKPVIALNGKTYCPMQFLNYINCTVESYGYDFEENETYIDIYRNHYNW